MALDAGVDLLILLAGTRVSLWLQTYERLLAQLDGSTPENAYRRRAERLILPQPADILHEQRADPARYLQRPLARQALRADRPIICVIPKEDDHLLTLRRFLADIVTDEYLASRDRPYSIMLLDDEADDASVLDSERSQKITPRLITALWSGEDAVTATHLIRQYLEPGLVGEDPRDIERLTIKMRRTLANNPFTKSGIEIALWDILGKSAGLPVYRLLGGAVRNRIPIKMSVSGVGPERAAELGRYAVSIGLTALKVKTGIEAEADVRRVRAVRAAASRSSAT